MTSKVKERNEVIEIPEQIAVRDLAERLGVSPVELLKVLIANGIMATITQSIDFDTAAIVGEDLGYTLQPEGTAAMEAEREAREAEEREAEAAREAEEADPEAEAEVAVDEEEPEPEEPGIPWYLVDEDAEHLETRAPIVTVMGHVDHGKTSLLDNIRQTRVAAGESGGITQHMGAYTASRDGRSVTFIDTPGHEAFTAMRARGAEATDIAVIVVAADDGVMPQTREAIDHAQAARVPIIIAINKIDLDTARPDRVKDQLAGMDVIPDSWGGDTFFVEVSATTGEGIDELLDAILLVAEEHQPVGNPTRPGLGTVLEGRIEQGRGVMATLLVQSGKLKLGDTVVVDTMYGRVKAMFDQTGQPVKEVGPSTPVEVMGLPDMPPAGSRFQVVKKEKEAKALVADREARQHDRRIGVSEPRMSLDELFAQAAAGEVKALQLVIKTDVQGTLEPVVSSVEELSGEVKLEVLHSGTGDITESDINLAAASEAIVIGFRVNPDPGARRAAADQGVEIREYEVIYKLVEDIQDALTGMLEPIYVESEIGRAEIREVFTIPRTGKIAGCYVQTGVVRRNANATVRRDGEEIGAGYVSSLKRFTDDVREVREGFECGIGISPFDDFEVGDTLVFTIRERER